MVRTDFSAIHICIKGDGCDVFSSGEPNLVKHLNLLTFLLFPSCFQFEKVPVFLHTYIPKFICIPYEERRKGLMKLIW